MSRSLTPSTPFVQARPRAAMVALARVWFDRASTRRVLARMDAAALQDIGLSRGHAAQECAKPFWRA